MPYNRYDITNRYNYRGRRGNDNIKLKTFFLIFLPILIIGIVALGIFVAYKMEVNGNAVNLPVASEDEVETVTDEELLHIVNEQYPLSEDYVPDLVSFGGVQVSVLAFDDLDNLISDAIAEGISIKLKTGYISYSDQAKLFEETFNKVKSENKYSTIKAESETMKICPEAGCSESQTGLLVQFVSDENEDFSKTEAFKWLEKNAVNYGFVLRYPENEEGDTGMSYAPDVYRYVGSEHALNMRRYGMSLEAYNRHVSVR